MAGNKKFKNPVRVNRVDVVKHLMQNQRVYLIVSLSNCSVFNEI